MEDILTELSGMGINISIDDFGSWIFKEVRAHNMLVYEEKWQNVTKNEIECLINITEVV